MSGDTSIISTRAVGPGPRSGLVAPGRPEQGSEELPADGEQFSLTLQSLLNAVSTPTRESLGKPGSATSPSQMFEPNRGDGRGGRLDTLKADDRSQSLRDPGRLHVDRGSVQQRAAGADRSGSSPASSLGRGLQPSSLDGSTDFESSKPSSSVQPRESAGAIPKGQSQREVSGQQVFKSQVDQSGRGTNRGLQPPPLQHTGSVNRPEGSVSLEAVNGSRGSDKTVAQQIARVLSGARSPAIDSVRPLAGSSGPAHTRDPQLAKRAADASAPRDARSFDELTGQKVRTAGGSRGEFDKLVRSIRLQNGPSSSSARLLLDPPELGRVQVDVKLAGDDLRITVLVANQDAHGLLAERAAELQDALAKQGINVQSMEINVRVPGQDSNRLGLTREAHESDRSKRANRSSEFEEENRNTELLIDGLAEWSSQEQAARTEARLDIEG